MFRATFCFLKYPLLFIFFLNAFSCKVERIAYFKDVPDSTNIKKVLQTIPVQAAIVHADDVLNITIQTLHPSANNILNQGNLPVSSCAVASLRQRNTRYLETSKEVTLKFTYTMLISSARSLYL